MAEMGHPLGFDDEPPAKERPWGLIAAAVAFILLGIFAMFVTHEKKNDKARKEILAALDKELTDDNDALKTQKEKLIDLTRQVDILRASITAGQYENGKKELAKFHKLQEEQHATREKYTQMVDAYNKKVARYNNLEQ